MHAEAETPVIRTGRQVLITCMELRGGGRTGAPAEEIDRRGRKWWGAAGVRAIASVLVGS
jgi:hypothetical protein